MKRDPETALKQIEECLRLAPDCPYHLVKKAVAIQLLDRPDGPSLEEALESLERAYAIDPAHIEALQELAHFFDAVMPDEQQAARFARLCLSHAERIVVEMNEILGSAAAQQQ